MYHFANKRVNQMKEDIPEDCNLNACHEDLKSLEMFPIYIRQDSKHPEGT